MTKNCNIEHSRSEILQTFTSCKIQKGFLINIVLYNDIQLHFTDTILFDINFVQTLEDLMEIKTRTRSEVEEYTVKMHRNKGKFAIIFELIGLFAPFDTLKNGVGERRTAQCSGLKSTVHAVRAVRESDFNLTFSYLIESVIN